MEKEEKVNPIALLSYIGILVLIPLLVERENEFVRFHVKQGLLLFICEVVTMVIGWFPIIGWLISFIGFILWIILSVIGIVNVLTGKVKPLPLIGKYAEKFKL